MSSTQEDIEKALPSSGEELAEIPVASLMTRNPATIQEQASIRAAVQVVIEKKIAGVPVVDNQGHLLGVVSENDLLLLAASGRMSRALQYTRDVDVVTPETTLKQALMKMIGLKRKWLPVIDEHRKLVGVLARSDLLKALLEKENG